MNINRCFILVALLLVLATPALAASAVLPPEHYDRPFAGELIVQQMKSQDEVRAACPGTTFPAIGAFGCAHLQPGGRVCRVILAPNVDIIAAGYTTGIVLRHEVGHCNGWSNKHERARYD